MGAAHGVLRTSLRLSASRAAMASYAMCSRNSAKSATRVSSASNRIIHSGILSRGLAGMEPSNGERRPAHGYAALQGRRRTMEDALLRASPCGDGRYIFGVFDGHGGRRTADFLIASLPHVCRSLPLSDACQLPEAARDAYEHLDKKLLVKQKSERWHDGSAALLAIVCEQQVHLLQVGDCQAALCGPDGAQFLCTEHRPAEPSEAKRLDMLGATVVKGRVHGLALSRAFGDLDVKSAGSAVTATPEVVTQEIDEAHEMLILGTDGLWDCMSADDAWEIVQNAGRSGQEKWELENAARALATSAVEKGSSDNVSVVVVLLNDVASTDS